jgi:hypothetical protein
MAFQLKRCVVTPFLSFQIVLRGRAAAAEDFMRCLRQLLPDKMHSLTRIEPSKYLAPSACKILAIPASVAVPQPSTKIFRIDLLDDDLVSVKWLGEVPSKCE